MDTVTTPEAKHSDVDLSLVPVKVDRATDLDRLIKSLTEELDGVKAFLREAAASGAFPANESGTVDLRSEETGNVAQVSFPKDTPILVDGTDPRVLKASLTSSQFELLFREVVTLQPPKAFEPAFAQLPKKLQDKVKKVVGWRQNTPTVRLPK